MEVKTKETPPRGLECKGVLGLWEKQGEEIWDLMDNFRTWRRYAGEEEGCRMMEKAAFGAELRWEFWVAGWPEQKPPEALVAAPLEKPFPEAEMILTDAAGSCMGKSDLQIGGGGKLHQNTSFCNGRSCEGPLPERAYFLPCGGSCGLGLGTPGHWKQTAESDPKGVVPAPRRKLPPSCSSLKTAALLGTKKKSSRCWTPLSPHPPTISKPHLFFL